MTQPQVGTVAGRQMVQQLLMAHAPLRSDAPLNDKLQRGGGR
ncbi:hypothetical protein [Streptomyces sp. NBC_00304]|nr:hypothetical protein [Streptomyces sp. NBC_00304]